MALSECYSPINLTTDEGCVRVACGHCPYCRRRKRLAWTGRLRLEALDHEKDPSFLTLTYKDEPPGFCYPDVQLFLKQIRNLTNSQIRYFAVAEYGEKNGRGHWHLITYGPSLHLFPDLVHHAWGLGRTQAVQAFPGSLAYVGGYCMKKHWQPGHTMCRMSLKPGIGLNRIGIMAKHAAQSGHATWPNGYIHEGRRYPLLGGGARHYRQVYEECGGVLPVDPTPDERHFVSMYSIFHRGSHIRSKALLSLAKVELGVDRYALKKA